MMKLHQKRKPSFYQRFDSDQASAIDQYNFSQMFTFDKAESFKAFKRL